MRNILNAYKLAEDALTSATPQRSGSMDLEIQGEEYSAEWEFADTSSIMRASFLCLLYSRFEYSLGCMCSDIQKELRQKFSHKDVAQGGYVKSRIRYLRQVLSDDFEFPSDFPFMSELHDIGCIRNLVVHSCGDFEDVFGQAQLDNEKTAEKWIKSHSTLANLAISKIHFERGFVPYVHDFLDRANLGLYEVAVSKRKSKTSLPF